MCQKQNSVRRMMPCGEQPHSCDHTPLCHWPCGLSTNLSGMLPLKKEITLLDFPGGSDGKGPACNAGDPTLIPGSRRFPGEGNGNLIQYSCLENSKDRGAWWALVHGIAKSWIQLNAYMSVLFVLVLELCVRC